MEWIQMLIFTKPFWDNPDAYQSLLDGRNGRKRHRSSIGKHEAKGVQMTEPVSALTIESDFNLVRFAPDLNLGCILPLNSRPQLTCDAH